MTAAVILAAGYGHENGQSKLLKTLPDGTPIIVQVVKNVRAVGGLKPIVVVINETYGQSIQSAIERAGFSGLEFMHQTDRLGAADALNCALPIFLEDGKLASETLVVFGDMPLLSPKLMRDMVAKHREVESKLTISSWPFDPDHKLASCMGNYAFLVRDDDINHRGTPLVVDKEGESLVVSMYNGMIPQEGDQVLSSLYVVDTTWAREVLPSIEPMFKGDGFPPEKHMPKLIEKAMISSVPVANVVCRNIAAEIIGVDAHTPKSYKTVCDLVEGL
ncbi:MAG: hypothetical protein COT91_03555 [Candidatus Doudnabacteria bacterium CG10_big_fil_rev_8_21_14_0_10_41_10]|uniref:MobA-like NTP transferase domain-containing protein n=1 Tax=Candidatus Doudnabacteria bacterium CG10_big_fil_rev_8_21_14_0_10_41_10 TaxID=1974551 RepID=A0A2H0VD23_9BACT|nr:MAG: hypothetical protein COT91_03555 [Candidatus Doudnabacteria bacterium CG10_big_fil_rev_8_21_14_0_10_41_10]